MVHKHQEQPKGPQEFRSPNLSENKSRTMTKSSNNINASDNSSDHSLITKCKMIKTREPSKKIKKVQTRNFQRLK